MSSQRKAFRASIIACARWETPYIAEWLVYHINLGFDHIYLYCNDDDPAEMRGEVDSLPSAFRQKVTFRPFMGLGLQAQMYHDALPRAQYESEWICFLDIDEFMALKKWSSVPQAIEYCEANGITGLYFNWLLYGHCGFNTRPTGPVLSLYNRRAELLAPVTKHISRAECFDIKRIDESPYPIWHGLIDPYWEGYKRANVLGLDYAKAITDSAEMVSLLGKFNSSIINAGYIAHFCYKSEDDARIRFERGLGGTFAQQETYLKLRDTPEFAAYLESINKVEDNYLRSR